MDIYSDKTAPQLIVQRRGGKYIEGGWYGKGIMKKQNMGEGGQHGFDQISCGICLQIVRNIAEKESYFC